VGDENTVRSKILSHETAPHIIEKRLVIERVNFRSKLNPLQDFKNKDSKAIILFKLTFTQLVRIFLAINGTQTLITHPVVAVSSKGPN
jgi:hypothetical protein